MKKQSHYLKRKVMERKKHTLVDNADEKRYEFDLGDDIAIIEYIKTQGFIILTHTEVPEKYEGRASAPSWCTTYWRICAPRNYK